MPKPKYDESNETQRMRTERHADRGAATPDDPRLTEDPEGPNEMHPQDFAQKDPEAFAERLADMEASREPEVQKQAAQWKKYAIVPAPKAPATEPGKGSASA